MIGAPPRKLKLLQNVAITLLAILAGTKAFDFTYLSVSAHQDAAQAYALDPKNGAAVVPAVVQKIDKGQGALPSSEDIRNIRKSLIRSPLNSTAVALTALDFDAQGKSQEARNLMRIAEKISRRSTINQIWLIEDASSLGQVSKALEHYHAALSVKPELSTTLIPILVSATAYPEVRTELQVYLSLSAPWVPAFINQGSESADPKVMAALILPTIEHLKDQKFEAAHARIVHRLAAQGEGERALGYAEKAFDQFDAAEFRQFRVTSKSTDKRMGLLAWKSANRNGIDARSDNRGGLNISIEPLVRGEVLSRDLIVVPGTDYETSFNVISETGSPPFALLWEATCLGNGSQFKIDSDTIEPPQQNLVRYRRITSIPQNCHLLRYRFIVDGPDSQSAAHFRLSGLNWTSANP